MALSREFMIERMLAADGEYDGRFITGVHSTGIYCLPSCKGRKPKPENVVFYRTIEEARAAGLRPCKRCCPDEFYRGEDVQLDPLEALAEAVLEDPAAFPKVQALSDHLAISSTKLYELFRAHYQITPAAFLNRARVLKAQQLLQDSASEASYVGYATGFEAQSAFYDNFKAQTLLTPGAYKKLGSSSCFQLERPAGYPLEAVLSAIARDPDSLSERYDGHALQLAARLPSGPALLAIAPGAGSIEVHVEARAKSAAWEAHGVIVHVLGLAQECGDFHTHVEKCGHRSLVASRHGLPIPQAPSFFDGLLWSIVGQQVNLRFAYALRNRLTERYGEDVGEGLRCTPSAARLQSVEPEELLPLQFSRRKAEYLIDAAKAFASEPDWPQPHLSATRIERRLLAMRGLGPWSVYYVMMRALGFPDCVPVGDSGLNTALQRYFRLPARPTPDETYRLMEPFRPYRSLATFNFWQSLSDPQ